MPPVYYVREAAPKLEDAGEESVYRRAGWLLGLGTPIRSEADLVERLERGLSVNAVRSLRTRLGLTDEEIYQLVAPRRTLTRREAEGQPLTAEEADRVVRVARVAARAQQVFGARPEYALEWLRTPQRTLGDRAPIRLLERDSGARMVEELLLALEHGFLA
jgi:putative toxin-antitoxin system antitoxin component (TIGR02293 family)